WARRGHPRGDRPAGRCRLRRAEPRAGGLAGGVRRRRRSRQRPGARHRGLGARRGPGPCGRLRRWSRGRDARRGPLGNPTRGRGSGREESENETHGTLHARLRARPETKSRVAFLVLTYDETIAWLQALEVTAGWDLKLERMQAALALRGHPEAAFPAVHVAGTN